MFDDGIGDSSLFFVLLGVIFVGVVTIAIVTPKDLKPAAQTVQLQTNSQIVEKPLEIPIEKPNPFPANYTFLLGDFNKDGVLDLWCIKRSNTGSGMTEVHVLNGKNFKEFLIHTETALHETPEVK